MNNRLLILWDHFTGEFATDALAIERTIGRMANDGRDFLERERGRERERESCCSLKHSATLLHSTPAGQTEIHAKWP